MSQRNPRIKNETHLKRIRRLPCVYCGDDSSMSDREAAHVRCSDPTIGKDNAGVGQKPHDKFALPLCTKCHRMQHEIGEEKFWRGADPVKLALAIYAADTDEEAERIIFAAQICETPNPMAAG